MSRPLRVINLAALLTPYSAGLTLQESISAERKQGLISDTLILLQHHPVYTLGKRGTSEDFKKPQEELEATGAEICVVPRGGEVTFHGPGQLVAYPIIDVRENGLGARAYVESLEDTLVNCLAKYGIAARGRVPGATGVWVRERKIAAIGVRISHGISSHGIALNVSTDLSYFDHIVPCGIPDKDVTSIARELAGVGTATPGDILQRRAAGVPGLAASLRPPLSPLLGLPDGSHTPSVPEVGQVVVDFVEAFRHRLGFGAPVWA